MNRQTMTIWVREALEELGGKATILDVCKAVWRNHGHEIKENDDLFYKWQYEIRWAADLLRRKGELKGSTDSEKGTWELEPGPSK